MSGRQDLSALRVATIIVVGALGAAGITSAQAKSSEAMACDGNEPQYSLDQTIAGCTAHIALNANDAAAYYNRGRAYDSKGQYDLAIADFNRAIQLTPDDADTYCIRGVANNHKGQYDLAIADYTRAIQLKPDDADAFNNRGIAYDDKGQYDSAIADFTRAIQLKPDFAEAFHNRGWAYLQKGEDQKAWDDADKAAQLTPTDQLIPALYAELEGEIQEKLNQRADYHKSGACDQAVYFYRYALMREPNMQLALDGLKRLGGSPWDGHGPLWVPCSP